MKIDPTIKKELRKYLLDRMSGKKKAKVTITAPYELERSDVENLKKKISILSEADIEIAVDKNILAGVVITFGSKVIDLTINTELQKLAHTIYETA
ncbi:hypothetical protein COY14_04350 [Candidatus Roizmanbacteria bacterium CG_4_10_14_0_2_um_filter_36_9]|uniref:Uncharacterized protein n=1 Tax=Candidatus Roizmanbacteria bacterium CG_4_10_14_0_2_um_filter_36_9 TaxID=1974823 RepID=A0A2M7U2N7_9BACT|nr:MAG: hypothetical protein COY14_04350 [Candidatus Roizmanbacteria bacterium CG_4_10_14_0_2_um_filter_36_9]